MAKITNKGPKLRMIVDKYLLPGESREISAKQLGPYRNDPDLEIVEDQPLQVEKPAGLLEEHLAFNDEKEETALLKVQMEVVSPELPGDSLEEKADFGEPEFEVEPIDRRVAEAELNLEPVRSSKKKRGEVQKPIEVQPIKKSRSKRK